MFKPRDFLIALGIVGVAALGVITLGSSTSTSNLLDRVSFQVSNNCSATSIEDTDISDGVQSKFLSAAHCFSDNKVGDFISIHNQYGDYSIKLTKLDKAKDLALLETTLLVPDAVPLDLSKPEFGAEVCAIGYAFGLPAKAYSCGRVSEIEWPNNSKNTYVVQGVAGGMSGGGLFNEDGDLIGVTQAMLSTQFEASSTFYFAITGETIKEFLDGPQTP